mmetsp:Transcript_5368/g.9266  ORF Transcript_5368/g.9266 Transcript_5368/m.9266 type:complete len:80 (+) Transcript_5368:37-276(+)
MLTSTNITTRMKRLSHMLICTCLRLQSAGADKCDQQGLIASYPKHRCIVLFCCFTVWRWQCESLRWQLGANKKAAPQDG